MDMTQRQLIKAIEDYLGLRATRVEPDSGDAAVAFVTLTGVLLLCCELEDCGSGWQVKCVTISDYRPKLFGLGRLKGEQDPPYPEHV